MFSFWNRRGGNENYNEKLLLLRFTCDPARIRHVHRVFNPSVYGQTYRVGNQLGYLEFIL